MGKLSQLFVVAVLAAGISGFCSDTVLKDDFSTNAVGEGIPAGWKIYRSGPNVGKIAVEENSGKKILHITDVCDKSEIGITRVVTVKKGKYYRLSCTANYAAGTKDKPCLQLRFSNPPKDAVFNTTMADGKTTSVTGQAVSGKAQLYVWTLKPAKPEFFVSEVVLEVSDTPFDK